MEPLSEELASPPPPAQRRIDKKPGLSPESHAVFIAGWMKGFYCFIQARISSLTIPATRYPSRRKRKSNTFP